MIKWRIEWLMRVRIGTQRKRCLKVDMAINVILCRLNSEQTSPEGDSPASVENPPVFLEAV